MCIEKPNTWALNGAAELVIDEGIDFEDAGPIIPSVGLRIKYKPNGQAYNADETSEEQEEPVIYEKLDLIHKLYEEEEVEGRLQIVLNHAKGLISPDGSIKTEMNPYAAVSLDGCSDGLKTSAASGRSPIWKLTDFIDFAVKRKDMANINITVYTGKNTFLGEARIPVGEVLRYPGTWAVNGLRDLLETDDRLETGTKKESLGKIYVQIKYLKLGMKDMKYFAPINDAKKFYEGQEVQQAKPIQQNDDDDDDF